MPASSCFAPQALSFLRRASLLARYCFTTGSSKCAGYSQLPKDATVCSVIRITQLLHVPLPRFYCAEVR